MTAGLLLTIIFWFRNAFDSGYLMIDTPNTFDNTAKTFKVAKIVDKAGRLQPDKYQGESARMPSLTRRVLPAVHERLEVR